MGEDPSLLGSKKSHYIKHSPQRAKSRLVNQAKLQGSFFWTGFASKEYTSGEGKSPVQERAYELLIECFWTSTLSFILILCSDILLGDNAYETVLLN